jgi:hypothetical protein
MNADPVFAEPEVTLERWAIVQHPEGTLHVAGLRDGEGRLSRMRMSTPIVAFDREAMTAETRSGRIYHLAADGMTAGVGIALARTFFPGEDVTELTPEDVELALKETSSPLRH